MICRKCSQIIPDDSEFCSFCGKKVEKGPFCPKCNQLIPEDSEYCPSCGSLIAVEANINLEEKTKRGKNKTSLSSKKRLSPLKVSLIIVLFLALAFIGSYFATYSLAKKCASSADFRKAQQWLFAPEITKLHDSNFVSLVNAWEELYEGKPSGLATIKTLAEKRYPLAVDGFDNAKKYAYDYAVKKYRAEEYNTAYQFFDVLNPYSKSGSYLALIKYMNPSASIEPLKKLIHFENVDEILLGVHAEQFLEGTWRSGDGYYYFKLERGADSNQTYYNLPSKDLSDSYYTIENGLFSLNNLHGSINLFRFEIQTEDSIKVYCFADDSYYYLHRE